MERGKESDGKRRGENVKVIERENDGSRKTVKENVIMRE